MSRKLWFPRRKVAWSARPTPPVTPRPRRRRAAKGPSPSASCARETTHRRAATSSSARWIARGPARASSAESSPSASSVHTSSLQAGASSVSAPRPAMPGPCPGSAPRCRRRGAGTPRPRGACSPAPVWVSFIGRPSAVERRQALHRRRGGVQLLQHPGLLASYSSCRLSTSACGLSGRRGEGRQFCGGTALAPLSIRCARMCVLLPRTV